MTTPFDRHILWVHWEGDAVNERSIGEMADAIKRDTPNVAGVVVKTSNGAVWQGSTDNKTAMAVNGPESVKTWVNELAKRGLETHLWCVVRGNELDAEADIVIRACNTPGVRSMLLDVEGGANYFGGKTANDARTLITRIRAGIRNDFHLGLNFDARGGHPSNIHINEWLPYVQSLHPMVYHWEFGSGKSEPEGYLDDCFGVLVRYGIPIVPMLQTYPTPVPMPEDEVFKAVDYAFTKGAVGVTLFRYGGESSSPPAIAAVCHVNPAKPLAAISPGTRLFRVIAQQMRIRKTPGTSAATVSLLADGEQIEVSSQSRTEAEGYVWWESSQGWVAQERVDRKQTLMVELTPGVPPYGLVTLSEETYHPDQDGPEVPQKRFKVVSATLNVRSVPEVTSESLLGVRFNRGDIIVVNADAWTEVNGFMWWNHGPGWSVEYSLDKTSRFLEDLTPEIPRVENLSQEPETPVPEPVPLPEPAPAPPTPAPSVPNKTFKIVSQSLNVRAEPGLARPAVAGATLRRDDQIAVAADAWRDVDGYRWWQHGQGWSAERILDGNIIFMEDLTPTVPLVEKGEVPAPEPDSQPLGSGMKRFHAVALGVKVRSEPNGKAPQVGNLMQGDEVLIDLSQSGVRDENDGYIWWKHNRGWSAECSTDNQDVLMLDPIELPLLGKLFELLPVRIEDTQWIQYYGNTGFAFRNGRRNSYDKFAQGLHSGLDFGHSGGAPIFAGVHGIFLGRGQKYGPNRVDVKVGDYTVIYGHIGKPANFPLRQSVTPDAIMGIVEITQVHLHLEVRYKDKYIINPLLLMPQALVDQFIGKFPPNPNTFVKTGIWTRWQTPFEQPIIRLGGEIIGPTA